jgi:hypothetical protein
MTWKTVDEKKEWILSKNPKRLMGLNLTLKVWL